MKLNLEVEITQEALSLVSGVAYSMVPDWYDRTYRNLKMDLIVPKACADHAAQPCLLFICGGAYSVVNGAVWMPEMMYFARRGYTVATIDYRTSNQAIFPAQLIDAKAAVRFLKAHAKQFCIDPARIIVAGESAGGTLAALVGTTAAQKVYEQGDYLEYDSSVAAVVDFYGPVDLTGITSEESAGGEVHNWTMPAFLGAGFDIDTTRRASALYQIDAHTPPFMILHGTADQLVDIASQSDLMYDKLRTQGIYTEYYRIPGAGHGADTFYQPPVKELILAFMNHVLGGKA